MEDCKISIMGVKYNICFVEKFPEYLDEYNENSDALCNPYNRTIYVKLNNDKDITEKGKERLLKKNLRHEIIHAFLFESGLSSNTNCCIGAWAEYEEMVDWIAIQFPKILKVFKEVGCI